MADIENEQDFPRPHGVVVAEGRNLPTKPVPTGLTSVDLLYAAVERGTPVDQLKELVALHEHMELRQARKAYFVSLAAFQRSAPQVKQSETAKIATRGGGSYSYTFAPLDEIARTIAPHLIAQGLSYRWDTAVEANRITVTCTVSHELGHSESSSMTLPIDSASAMSEQQKVGSAMTFGQRRSLTAALGLVTTDSEAPPQEDTTPVSVEQADQIDDMIDHTGADRVKFLKWIGFERVHLIPATRFDEVMRTLREAHEKKGGR
jgi:hypothetical protein